MRHSHNRGKATSPGPFFYGWMVLACVSGTLFVTYGIQYSFGVFFTAMLPDLGWSRASLAGAFSLYSLVYIGLSVLSGRLTDRFGPRGVMLLGGICLGSGMILTSRMREPWQLYLFYGGLAGIGMSAAYIPCTATVVKWFRRRRGLAISLAGCGASLGITVMPLLSEILLARIGWRHTYLLFGVAVLVVLTLLASVMVRDPAQLGLQPDGDVSPSKAKPIPFPERLPETSWSVHAAIRTRTFWMLAGVMVLSLGTIPSVYVHLPQYAADLHLQLPRSRLLMLVGLGALGGNLLLGRLADFLGRRQALQLSLLLGALALAGMTVIQDAWLLSLAALCFGLYYGTFASLFPAVMGDVFGSLHAGTLTGLSFALGSVSSAVGPVAMGWIADHTGTYALAFLAGTLVNTLVLVLLALARPPTR